MQRTRTLRLAACTSWSLLDPTVVIQLCESQDLGVVHELVR